MKPIRQNPVKLLRAERTYAKQLKQLARHVGNVIAGFPAGEMEHVPTLTDLLRKYAEALVPWARVTAGNMLKEVNHRDLESWRSSSLQISEGLRREILGADVGDVMRRLLDDQVDLITSIPIEAAQRVHRLTLQGLEDGTRAKSVVEEIMRSGDVTDSRAMLIARTETSRTSTVLTQARATAIGSTHYIWRSSGDGDVRDDHKKLNGKAFSWNNPPVADERTGAKAHPGAIYNCRCWAEPILE